MFDFQNSMFAQVGIPNSAKIVFVADMFVEDYVGGAELTTEALITSSPFEVYKLHAKDVTLDLLRQGHEKFWVFGNFTSLNPELIPSLVGNIKYSVLEYDYKFCKFRSIEKHQSVTGKPCDCADNISGKMVSAFYFASMGLWWMSEAQKDRYTDRFPFLNTANNTVLSSVFTPEILGYMKSLRTKYTDRKKWIVLGSDSWIKGASAAETWCKENNKDYEILWNVPYNELLDKLAQSEGFVYLPEGGDTCPRMVIEAKLLGCKLQLNTNVQHASEEWFNTNDLEDIEGYLFNSPKIFWNGIKAAMDYQASISGYTTTMNCVKQEYPFEQCITSMLQFCSEVCVVDGGSTDGTWEKLVRLAHPDFEKVLKMKEQIELIEDIRAIGSSPHQNLLAPTKLKLRFVGRDWDNQNFAVFDGLQKAEARRMCTQEFCWQMDSDEIVHEDDVKRIIDIARAMPKDTEILALPVVEYWGGADKVRLDVTPWKWRLSRNNPNITHGIPKELRRNGEFGIYAAEGTDGCDMIYVDTFERVPFISFYTEEADRARKMALLGNTEAFEQYQQWFNQVIMGLPGVYHYSWFDLSRKIKLYRGYWTKHWNSLYGKDVEDTATNNMMFDVPWSQVTDDMIEELASRLKKTGGHVWHRKWTGNVIPHMTVNKSQPKIML